MIRPACLLATLLLLAACPAAKTSPPPPAPTATASPAPDPLADYIADVRAQMADIDTRFRALQPTVRDRQDERLNKVAIIVDRNLTELETRLEELPNADPARAEKIREEIANLLAGANAMLERGAAMATEEPEP